MTIIKDSLPYNNMIFNVNEENKHCILLAGTKCLETRYYLKGEIPILGLVFQNGFNTVKGQVLRSILFPKNNSFKFYRDSLIFIMAMLGGFVWALVALIYNKGETEQIVLKSLDVITVVLPPVLLACLMIGV